MATRRPWIDKLLGRCLSLGNTLRFLAGDGALSSRLLLLVGFVFLFGLGCGPTTFVPVTGVLTLDGKPVAGASVVFQQVEGDRNENHISSAGTDEAGKFVLITDEKPGAYVGSYKISVRKVRVEGVVADPDGLSGTTNPTAITETWEIPEKYGRFETSGFTAEIAPGMAPIELKMVQPKDHSGEDQ